MTQPTNRRLLQLVRRGVAGAAVLVVTVVAVPRPAAAVGRTPASTTTTTAAQPGGTGGCGVATRQSAQAASVVPDDCWGHFPSSHYDIGFDEGAWNHISRKVYGTFTDLAFEGARSATAMALWLVEWAYSFGVYDSLGGAAVDNARDYQADMVGPLGLVHLTWFYAVAWAAFTALRGRLTMAGGELLMSVLAAGIAAVFLASPGGYLAGTFDTMGRLSGALLATGTGRPPPANGTDAQAVLGPLQAQIHAAFVEQPYDYLDWGGPLVGPCAAARDRILADGPHGADDEPRKVMEDAGCKEQVEFNQRPTGTRLFGAVLTMVAAAVMAVLMGLVAVTVVVAQVMAVVLFAVAPFALLAAVLPGGGRELAWRWLAGLIRVGLTVVGMSFVLSLLLLTVSGLLGASVQLGLVERFALVDLVVVAMLVARKRVLAAGHGLAGAFGQRLAARRAGGERATPWMANPAVAGATGFALGTSLGSDRSGRTSRLTAAAGRNYLANRRVNRSAQRADARAVRRASATVARQRTEVTADAEGRPVQRMAATIDGPVPTSRRARRARSRLEARTGKRVATQTGRRPDGWRRLPRGKDRGEKVEPAPDIGDDGVADPEEA